MSDIPNGKALAKCFIIPEDNRYTLNQRIGAIRTNIVDYKFLYFILNRNDYYLAFDSGTGQTNLKKNDILDCPVNLPATKEEQTKIATILSDMDAELSALEQKLEKYKKVKLGMMQELLTGKTRLV
jgi:type I restriction enzyme S subunit